MKLYTMANPNRRAPPTSRAPTGPIGPRGPSGRLPLPYPEPRPAVGGVDVTRAAAALRIPEAHRTSYTAEELVWLGGAVRVDDLGHVRILDGSRMPLIQQYLCHLRENYRSTP